MLYEKPIVLSWQINCMIQSGLNMDQMKKVWIVITVATLYVIFFQLSPYIGIPDQFIIALFIFSPFVVAYMAFVILKDGKPSDATFNERFYEDHDYEKIADE